VFSEIFFSKTLFQYVLSCVPCEQGTADSKTGVLGHSLRSLYQNSRSGRFSNVNLSYSYEYPPRLRWNLRSSATEFLARRQGTAYQN